MLVLLSGAYSFSIILCNREFFVEMTIVASLNSHNFSVQLASFFLLNSSDNDTKNGEKEEKKRVISENDKFRFFYDRDKKKTD